MRNAIGLILASDIGNKIKELTDIRSSAAVPIGGKYRVIDFTLSNMVNSGIINVGILVQHQYRSMMDHLGSGGDWDLDRRNGGLFIFPPLISPNQDEGYYKGSADAMYNNIGFINGGNEEYVIISRGNCVYKADYNFFIEFHEEKNADITVVYRTMDDVDENDIKLMSTVYMDENGRITDIHENPSHLHTKDVMIGTYVIRKSLLVTLLEDCRVHKYTDFTIDVLFRNIGRLKIMGCKFDGFWRPLVSLGLYYKCNMEMMREDVASQLFTDDWRIFTKVKDETPAKYNEEAEVTNSVIADGCIIEGKVEDSVLFRGVTIKKGSFIKNCIIMQGTVIDENCNLICTIIDKDVEVHREKSLHGMEGWPVFIAKGSIVK